MSAIAQKFVERKVYVRNWVESYARILWLANKRGPFYMMHKLRRFPWMWNLLKANRLLSMMTRTRSGVYHEANAVVITNIISSITEIVDEVFAHPESTVLHEDLIPPEILYGMGLTPWMAEFLGIVMPLIDTRYMEDYIDTAENEGIPPDV